MTKYFKQVYSKSFEEHIRSILQRTSSQPLVLPGSLSEATPDEWVKFLRKATNTLRDNYIIPQNKAREEIRKR